MEEEETYHPAPESPKPCRKNTVPVCFFSAGTTSAAGLDIARIYKGGGGEEE